MEMIDTCHNFAKFQYECGNYSGMEDMLVSARFECLKLTPAPLVRLPGAAEYLFFHRVLVQPNDKNYLNGLWGKLASEILMQNWDPALDELKRLQVAPI